MFIIIQVPLGYLLRVGVAGPSGRWLAGLPRGPRSARAGGGRDTNTEPEVPSDAGPGRATVPPVSLRGAVRCTVHVSVWRDEETKI